jgi:hypothetical protein
MDMIGLVFAFKGMASRFGWEVNSGVLWMLLDTLFPLICSYYVLLGGL